MNILRNCIFIAGLTTFVAYVVGQREVEINVDGESILRTDIRTYTIYRDSYYRTNLKSFAVTCNLLISVPSTLSLFRNNDLLNRSFTYNIDTKVAKVFKYDNENMSSLAGTYFCRIDFTRGDVIGSALFSYSMESKMNIAVDYSSVCASSIGYSGYVGEYGVLNCEPNNYVSFQYSYQGQWRVSLGSYKPLGFSISSFYDVFRMKCQHRRKDSDDWTENCLSRNFTLYRNLSLELSQLRESGNFSTIEFVCKSKPPRLMYWEVVGENGNILDLYQSKQSFHVEGNITIKDSVGNSSIRLTGSILANKNIHTVLCSTYGTRVRVVASASLRPIDATELQNILSTSPSYNQKFGDNPSNTTTNENIFNGTHRQSTEGMAKPMPQVTPICAEKGKFKQLSVKNHFLTGALGLLLIIIFLLTLLLFYTIYRLRKSTGMKRGWAHSSVQSETHLTTTNVSTETHLMPTIGHSELELHENPVYLPFSES